MPAPVPYIPRPYVGETYQPSGRLGDYMRQDARTVADAMRQRGAQSAAMWAGIGGGISGTLRDLAAYPEQVRQRQMGELRLKREQAAVDEAARKRDEDQQNRIKLQALQGQFPGQRIPREVLLQTFSPQDAAGIEAYQDKLFPATKPVEPVKIGRAHV